jgi:rRNA maturation endonuclease Nob1
LEIYLGDKLIGMLDENSIDFDNYARRKRFRHLYFCEKCVRSFETNSDERVCKFCGSGVKEIGEKKLTRYVCPACYHSVATVEKIEKCPKCGNKILHSYPIEKMSKREFLRMRRMQIKGGIKNIFRRTKNLKK